MDNLVEKVIKNERLIQKILRNRLAPNANCFTIEEAAESIGVGKDTVQGYIKKGVLACRYPNAKKCIHYKDLDRYLKGMKPK